MVQLLLQYPQSLLVFNIVANWPVIGHLHIPNWHIEPKLHLLPHDPQLLLSWLYVLLSVWHVVVFIDVWQVS